MRAACLINSCLFTDTPKNRPHFGSEAGDWQSSPSGEICPGRKKEPYTAPPFGSAQRADSSTRREKAVSFPRLSRRTFVCTTAGVLGADVLGGRLFGQEIPLGPDSSGDVRRSSVRAEMGRAADDHRRSGERRHRWETEKAIQAAVDTVARLGGGTVKISPGTYRMRNTVWLSSGVRLFGAGRRRSFSSARRRPASSSKIRIGTTRKSLWPTLPGSKSATGSASKRETHTTAGATSSKELSSPSPENGSSSASRYGRITG